MSGRYASYWNAFLFSESSRLNKCNLYLLVHSQSDGDNRLGEGELKDELRVLVLLGVIPDQH